MLAFAPVFPIPLGSWWHSQCSHLPAQLRALGMGTPTRANSLLSDASTDWNCLRQDMVFWKGEKEPAELDIFPHPFVRFHAANSNSWLSWLPWQNHSRIDGQRIPICKDFWSPEARSASAKDRSHRRDLDSSILLLPTTTKHTNQFPLFCKVKSYCFTEITWPPNEGSLSSITALYLTVFSSFVSNFAHELWSLIGAWHLTGMNMLESSCIQRIFEGRRNYLGSLGNIFCLH